MHHPRLRALPFLLAFACFHPLFSFAETLTLEQALQEAREHNPDYLKTVAVADEASARKLEALSGHLPRLTASGGYLTNHKFLLFPINGGTFEAPNPISIVTLDLGLNVFDGFQ